VVVWAVLERLGLRARADRARGVVAILPAPGGAGAPVTLTRRHWLFGAAAALLVPERRIFLPARGEYGYSYGFPIPVVFGQSRVDYRIRAYYNGGDVDLVSEVPFEVGDVLSIMLDRTTYVARINEVTVGVVNASTASHGVAISDKRRYLRRGQPELSPIFWDPNRAKG
jgi:hypothetical protein